MYDEPKDPETTGLIRCDDGPLDGKWHAQGDAFEFDGRPLRIETGIGAAACPSRR